MSALQGRRAVLKTLAAGAAAGTTTRASAQESAATPEVRWQLISSFSKTLDLMYGGAETFASVVGDLTGGRFHIDVSPPTEAISGLQVLDAVTAGTLDACQTSMDYFYGKDPAFALATAIPFGMNAREQFAFATQGGGDAQLNEVLADSNALAFAAGNTGAQMGGFFKREIKTASDVSGLKIRIGGLAGRVMQKLGAEPAATPRADFYAALNSGALDAVTWVSPHDDEKLSADDATRLTKLAPYYYYPGWWRGGSAVHIVVDKRKFDALPPAFQAAVRTAATVSGVDMLARYDSANPAALRRLVIGGAQLRPFPQDVLEAAYKATNDTLREIGDANARFRKQLDALIAFRNEQYLWWQVGEYTFDNFLIRQRAKG
jgi:TRAP-type mannitol/chloroaromatic compound transport system substrate-binding protein